MKNLIVTLLALGQFAVFAQKEEKIEYYTDSEVKRSIVSVQAGYMPYFTNRRLIANSVNPQNAYFFLDNSVTGKFGQAYGADILFGLNSNFQVGVGLYNSFAHYQWDYVKIIDQISGNGDTLNGQFKVDIKANYLNVPIQFGFVTQVADYWYLQVFPALELNFLQQLERNYTIDDPNLRPENNDDFGDITQKGTQFNMTINFGLGAEYRALEKVGIFTRLSFRYMFFEIEEEAAMREVIYTIGGHMGVRYYF